MKGLKTTFASPTIVKYPHFASTQRPQLRNSGPKVVKCLLGLYAWMPELLTGAE